MGAALPSRRVSNWMASGVAAKRSREPEPASSSSAWAASYASRAVSVKSVASGGQAKRTGVYRFVPQPALTCR